MEHMEWYLRAVLTPRLPEGCDTFNGHARLFPHYPCSERHPDPASHGGAVPAGSLHTVLDTADVPPVRGGGNDKDLLLLSRTMPGKTFHPIKQAKSIIYCRDSTRGNQSWS